MSATVIARWSKPVIGMVMMLLAFGERLYLVHRRHEDLLAERLVLGAILRRQRLLIPDEGVDQLGGSRAGRLDRHGAVVEQGRVAHRIGIGPRRLGDHDLLATRASLHRHRADGPDAAGAALV